MTPESSLSRPLEYCTLTGTGYLVFDPLRGTKHFEPWWALLACDDQIPRYYAWFLARQGKPVWVTGLWGTHVSVVKHEEPPDKAAWGVGGEVEFRYTPQVRWDNGKHAWLDVYSPALSQVRTSLGLPAKEWFHLTIGRLA